MENFLKHLIFFFYIFHICFAARRNPTQCLDETGTALLQSATACENIRDDAECAGIFRETIAEGPAMVDINCPNPIMEFVANQCAKRCGLCCNQPEFRCLDLEASPIDCTQNRHKCRDPEWKYVMDYFCPATCGSCLSGALCRDLNPFCTNMAQLCNDMNFMSFMTARCARTCNRCTLLSTTAANTTTASCTSQCADTAPNCASNIALCNSPTYFNVMSQKCPATCGRCGTSNSGTCSDTNANCATWVRNGYCSNTFYTTAQKRQSCGRSCNLC